MIVNTGRQATKQLGVDSFGSCDTEIAVVFDFVTIGSRPDCCARSEVNAGGGMMENEVYR